MKKIMSKIYLASSWRNDRQPIVVKALRHYGHQVYDFRNPTEGYANPNPEARPFQWSEIDEKWERWSREQYINALSDPISGQGFASDYGAMRWATTGVLLLPSGRSAHIEAGYFIGAGKPLHILLEDDEEPELMYLMATAIWLDLDKLAKSLLLYER